MKIKHFFTGFKEGFTEFGHNISTIVNSVLLSFVYLFGVGITSIIAKITKKYFLETEIKKSQKSYWSNLDLKKQKIDDYYRQF